MAYPSDPVETRGFAIKDSGERQQFESGMVRDTTEGKIDYTLALDGPMFERYAEHLTKGAQKYAKRNWMQAEGEAEYERFRESALRHLLAWYRGDRDEDHAAAVIFNINGAEYVLEKMNQQAEVDQIIAAINDWESMPGFSWEDPVCGGKVHTADYRNTCGAPSYVKGAAIGCTEPCEAVAGPKDCTCTGTPSSALTVGTRVKIMSADGFNGCAGTIVAEGLDGWAVQLDGRLEGELLGFATSELEREGS